MLNIVHFIFNHFQEKTRIVWKDNDRCVIIDPGFCNQAEKDEFLARLAELKLVPEAVLLTHGHADHIFGAAFLQDKYGIPVYMNALEREILKFSSILSAYVNLDPPDCGFEFSDIKDGDIVEAAGMKFRVIATPGHTPGGVCYLIEAEKALFCGDTLFAGSIGRTDFKYGNYDDEIRSIMEKLIVLDPQIKLYPGHGPDSSIAQERTQNPFLEPFNEPEESEETELNPVIIRESDPR